MSLVASARVLTGLTLAVVMWISARHHRLQTETEDTFTLSPAIAYLMGFLGVFFCVVPYWPGAAGGMAVWKFFLGFSPFWLGAFVAGVYFLRYRVTVSDQMLTYGAFRLRSVPFTEVIDWEVLPGRSEELVVYLKDGRRLKFSGMLGDFGALKGLINSHMAIPPPGHPDSEAKLRDRQRRKDAERRAWWWMGFGAVLITVVVVVIKRMGLG